MRLKYSFFTLAIILLVACQQKAEPKVVEGTVTNVVLEQEASSQDVHPGKDVYNQNCKVCHQANGEGVSGVFPPLTPNRFVRDKEQFIDIVLNGMKGEVEVDGKTYNGLMTPHKHLTNQQIADVISYVRTSFGNEQEAVSPKEVEAAR